MDVIRCDQQDYLVWKWRPANQELNSTSKENAIRYGSTLHVKDGEMCVFVYKQKDQSLQDFITGPYEDTIKTANFPVLSSIVGATFGGSSPFPAEVYFFNLQGNNQIKFGVPYFDVADPRFVDFTVPVAVRGQITFTLSDVKQFIKLNRLVDFSLERFSNQISDDLKKSVKEYVTNYPIENGISVLQIERKIAEISDLIQAKLTPHFSEDFGVTLKRFDLSTIEIDKESEDYKDFIHVTKEQQKIQAEQIGKRAQIDTDIYERRGHLGTEQQFIQAHAINQQTEVMKVAAESMGKMPSGVSGGGESFNPAGMMMGMAMGGAIRTNDRHDESDEQSNSKPFGTNVATCSHATNAANTSATCCSVQCIGKRTIVWSLQYATITTNGAKRTAYTKFVCLETRNGKLGYSRQHSRTRSSIWQRATSTSSNATSKYVAL